MAILGASGLAYVLRHPGALSGFIDHATHQVANVPKAAMSDMTRDAGDVSIEPAESRESGTVAIPAGNYGHFETGAEINGRDVDVMVDTGASLVALTYEDAAKAGIYVTPSDFTHFAQTANGTARVAPITISKISIGDITVRNVPAIVSERGASERTLLGMSFLNRLSRVEMRSGTLVLQE
jgi:aspartyl protease family protein